MNSENLTLAIQIAAEVHAGQKDKAGEDYILHCLAVMDMVAIRVRDHNRKRVMVVAVLHDSIEDYPKSGADRQRFRSRLYDEFGNEIDLALDALTHRRGESYEKYIERVALNWMARYVKIADLTHNMDPRRIPASQIVDKDFARWDKYRRALIRLERED